MTTYTNISFPIFSQYLFDSDKIFTSSGELEKARYVSGKNHFIRAGFNALGQNPNFRTGTASFGVEYSALQPITNARTAGFVKIHGSDRAASNNLALIFSSGQPSLNPLTIKLSATCAWNNGPSSLSDSGIYGLLLLVSFSTSFQHFSRYSMMLVLFVLP